LANIGGLVLNLEALLLKTLLWNAQLLVALFFIAGFVSFYLENWGHAFRDKTLSHSRQLMYRVLLIVQAVFF
jgi:hypothetical protein